MKEITQDEYQVLIDNRDAYTILITKDKIILEEN